MLEDVVAARSKQEHYIGKDWWLINWATADLLPIGYWQMLINGYWRAEKQLTWNGPTFLFCKTRNFSVNYVSPINNIL